MRMPNKYERTGLGNYFGQMSNFLDKLVNEKVSILKPKNMQIEDISLESDHILFSVNDDEWYQLPCTKEQVIKKTCYFDWEEIHNRYVQLAVGRDMTDSNEYKQTHIDEFHLSDDNLKDYVINNQDLWERV